MHLPALDLITHHQFAVLSTLVPGATLTPEEIRRELRQQDSSAIKSDFRSLYEQGLVKRYRALRKREPPVPAGLFQSGNYELAAAQKNTDPDAQKTPILLLLRPNAETRNFDDRSRSPALCRRTR